MVKNPYFTCIGKGHGAPVIPSTREEWETLRREPWLAEMCRRIEAGDEQLKHRLPVWTPSCAAFKNNHRAKADAVQPLPRLMLDFDEKGHSQEILEKALQLNETGTWQVLLVEESVRRGTHVLITLPEGMSAQEAQERFSAAVGFKADPSLKDVSRCIYMVTEGHTLWVSEKLFKTPLNPPSMGELGNADTSVTLREGNYNSPSKSEGVPQRGEGVCQGAKNADTLLRPSATSPNLGEESGDRQESENKKSASSVKSVPEENQKSSEQGKGNSNCTGFPPFGGTEGGFPTTYRGIPYKDILRAIAEELGGEPTEGERNAKVLRMASSLRHICDNNPEWLMEIIPTYGLPVEEWRKTIQNACKDGLKYGPTKVLNKALEKVGGKHSDLPSIEGGDGGRSVPPSMPTNLPPLIALLVKNVPAHARAATAHAVFPALGAHLGGVKFRYIDNVEHEATFMCLLLAKMSSGKGAVNTPIEYILADIKERDAYNRLREQEWKDAIATKGANKEKPKRPEGLTVQVLSPDMTNAAFVQRLKDAEGKFLYSRMDEVELLDNLKTGGRGNQVSQIIRLAFDQGEYGQERVGAGSVTALARVKWNWNASSTIQKGRWYFRNALTDGTLSRLNICTINPTRGADIPVYGTYDETFAEALKPYIGRLNEARGLVKCPKAEQLARKLMAENAERALLSDDEAYEVLSYRANVIAYLKAMTLYVAHGKWRKEFDEFIRWSEEYDLWCKMHFFGDALHEAMSQEEIVVRRGPRNMLALLPETFTKEEVVQLRKARGMTGESDAMLKAWLRRGYIVRSNTDSIFTKTQQGGNI